MNDTSILKDNIKKEYRYRTELHSHTCPVSTCSHISPEDTVSAYASLGYDCVVITNHFLYSKDKIGTIESFFDNFYRAEDLGKKVGIKVLLGAEIRFTENVNDYLVYGVDRNILENIFDLLPYGIAEFKKNIDLKNSIILQAHPFRDHMTAVSPSLVDGIEVFNMHPWHNSRVGVASKYARENKIQIVTAGTDLHESGHEGLSALLTRIMPDSSFDIASILKSRDYVLEISQNNIIIP